MLRSLLNSLLYFPSREIVRRPADAGLAASDLTIETEDEERLHGWWVRAHGQSRGHLLLCHGNGGNIGDRLDHARLLVDAGFDVLLFDYRGYGASSGRPSEEGTYRDARAARRALLEQAEVDGPRISYLGESLGGAVALRLASEEEPHRLILQSTFTSVRDLARLHYPFLPGALVPDAYPSIRRVRELSAPLLVLHGERDDIVPASHGRTLYEEAAGPKRIRTFPGLGHNDLVPLAGQAYIEAISGWMSEEAGA